MTTMTETALCCDVCDTSIDEDARALIGIVPGVGIGILCGACQDAGYTFENVEAILIAAKTVALATGGGSRAQRRR